MEITFELIDGLYTAEFEVQSNCNIHVEREGKGHFFILQRGTKTGKYAVVSEEDYNKTTIDVDMLGSIYPKYIKVTSASMPTYAEVNFGEEGGGSGGIDPNDPESEYFTEYFNFSVLMQSLGEVAGIGITDFKKGITICQGFMVLMFGSTEGITQVSFMPNKKIIYEGSLVTVKELLESEDFLGVYNSLPRITKEEFYNLEA